MGIARLASKRAVTTLVVLSLACRGPSHNAREATLAATGLAIDTALPPAGATELAQSEANPVGTIVNLASDAAGRLYIADWSMRDVKVYSRSGQFLHRLGRQGRGPGEYMLPIWVTASPLDARIGVVDISQSRLLVFDGATTDTVATLTLESPVSLHSAAFGPGDTLLVAGIDERDDGPNAAGAAFLAGGRDVVSRVASLPSHLQRKALSSNVLIGVMGQTQRTDFVMLSGGEMVYQTSLGGTLRDSVLLPSTARRPVKMIEQGDWKETPTAMGDFVRTQEWVNVIYALNDSMIVLDIQESAPPEAPPHEPAKGHRFAIVNWNGSPKVWMTSSCECRLLGGRGDTLALFQEDSTGRAIVQWRTLGTLR